jgi:hypothetical protein
MEVSGHRGGSLIPAASVPQITNRDSQGRGHKMLHPEAPKRVGNAQARFGHANNSRTSGRESFFADQAGYVG